VTHEGISDTEIKMIGYVFRKDRNCKVGKKRRGRGVLLFVREELIAHEVTVKQCLLTSMLLVLRVY
jgi:hypothetical protein